MKGAYMDRLQGLAAFISEKDNLIIFIFAGVNFGIFVASLIIRAVGNTIRYPKGELVTGEAARVQVSRKTGKRLRGIGRTLMVLYQIYANITAVFPLLGIMGTVAALITVAESTDLMSNLMVALTTTLNGVIWAVIFKCLDAVLSAPLDSFLGVVDSVENLLEEAGKGDIEIVDDTGRIQVTSVKKGEEHEEETDT
jgi:chemotaxis protein MotA